MEENVQDQDSPAEIQPESETVLVFDKETNMVETVEKLEKGGTLKKRSPENRKDDEPLIRVDKHGDVFSNFFSNFYRQLKNPSRFHFFKISEYDAVNTGKDLRQDADQASTEEKEELEDCKAVSKKDNPIKNQNTMENTPNTETEYRYSAEQIDWKTMEKLGLNKEKLEKLNALDPLLRGFKSNTLVPVTIRLGSAVSKMDVRLSLQPSDTDRLSIQLHAIRREPSYNLKFLGHEFSEEDKQNLRETGNMGRVVDLVNPKTNEIIPSVISRDRLTNELVAYRAEYIKVPDEIKGIKLDEHQKQTLLEGKPLYLEGMTSIKGELFDATVQFNADKRYVEFIFNNNHKQDQKEERNQGQNKTNQSQNTGGEVPRVFRGQELDDRQYEKFKAGETVYVSGLMDGKGKEYQGYITFNKETAKTDFSFTHPNKLKEKAEAAEDHKTQKAVNTDGKTNEATKNLKEPLKSKQQQPNNKQQEAEQQKKPVRSRGRKL